jgi:hypothetical protein
VTGLTYTLLGDGTSDRLLDYPLRWVLSELGVRLELGQWADLRRVSPKPRTLTDRARAALDLYPAQLLVVHRDAEAAPHADRVAEIADAVRAVAAHHVAVVPVRMTEAWLLHDVAAIRRASGNPHGSVALSLPTPANVEAVPNPKETLETALLTASELTGRRRQRRKADFPRMRERTAELITGFSELHVTPAFASFVSALRSALVGLRHLEDAS